MTEEEQHRLQVLREQTAPRRSRRASILTFFGSEQMTHVCPHFPNPVGFFRLRGIDLRFYSVNEV